ncbi:MAG: PilN domain-containing protein [Fimbriimonadaceae bacterium]
MPLINLIQEQQLSGRREEARARLFFMSFVASAAAAAAAFGFLLFQTDAAKGELADMEAKNQKMAPLLKQIEDNSRLASQLSPRLNTLESAQLLTSRWNNILDHLVVNTPAQTWLTGIRCVAQDPSKPVSISFVGMAASQELVGEMILRLQGSPELQGVNLKYTQEKVVTEGNGIEFEISADLTGTAAEKPKDEQEASK